MKASFQVGGKRTHKVVVQLFKCVPIAIRDLPNQGSILRFLFRSVRCNAAHPLFNQLFG